MVGKSQNVWLREKGEDTRDEHVTIHVNSQRPVLDLQTTSVTVAHPPNNRE